MTGRRFLTDDEEAVYRSAPRLTTPSRVDEWEGRYDLGERFSREQLYSLGMLGRDLAAVESVDVVVAGDARRIWLPGVTYFYRRVPCPIVGEHGGRLRIVSPFGTVKLVYPDGSLTSRVKGR